MEVFLSMFREEMPEYICRLERKALAEEVPIIRRGTQDVLRYFLRTGKPAKVLEVGTAVGYSALFMRECLPESSRITTIEKVEMRLTEARKNFAAHDPDGRIRLLAGEAGEVLHGLAEAKDTFDFIFLDAAKGQYLSFLPDILAILAPEGILISDNILHEGDVLESRYAVTRRDRTIHGRMREYLQELTSHEQLETLCLPVGDGMTVSQKKKRA
ncbi:MAG: O-methyltransferase [Lachnospiraceae bacterium]|nr:O-methyltransferase [Lachnospiraceae bacterium]